MIIYNDIKNLTPFKIESEKMQEALRQDDVKLLDEEALMSEEYYELSALRKQTLATNEKVLQYIDICYEHTFSKSNLTIYFSWFVEILCYKYGVVGLSLGAEYLNAYLDVIIEKIENFDEQQITICIKQLAWLGDAVSSIFKNLSLLQPGIEPIYNFADYTYINKPGKSQRLLTKEEEKFMSLEKFQKAFDSCPIEYLQSVSKLLIATNTLIDSTEKKAAELIEKKAIDDIASDVLYPTKSILNQIIELYNRQLSEDEVEAAEEDIAKAYAAQEEEVEEHKDTESIETTRAKIKECINFLEQSYPHTPVIMLLKAAHQWLGMSFDKIINSLMQKNASLESLYAMLTPPPPPPPQMGGMGGPPGGGFGGPGGMDMGPGGGMPPPPNF